MSWRTNQWVLLGRNLGRAVGINALIARRQVQDKYEAYYDDQLSALIYPGDCIWDIGANVGHYTRQFSERVGPTGRVVAFEPSPINFGQLATHCAALSNVSLFQVGLGNQDFLANFAQGSDDLGATSHVTDSPHGSTVVNIRAGDSLITHNDAPLPDIIKIDVEGFEWEVLNGMSAILKNSKLRAIGIEVHFGILVQRDLGSVPQQIEQQLKRSGFQLTWADNSHLLACREA
jgi:FkbM family methyltransferase